MAAAHTLNPQDAPSMASRRAPLANVPNAVNSPFRGMQPLAGKRTRAQLGENTYGQPPTKKQLLETPNKDDGENVDPLKRSGATVISNDKLDEPFSTKRTSTAPPTAFERKLASVRDKKPTPQPQSQQTRVDRTQVAKGDNLENVRQWQRHYRRQFPQFVFYFDSLPDDVRVKAIRQIRSLGAREEKFFSNAVTHVVTTRQIPSENANTSPDDEHVSSKRGDANGRATNAGVLSQDQRKTTSLLDASLQRRVQTQGGHVALDTESRRGHAADILTKARELGIKIWALEKLQRVLSTMLQADTGEQGATQDARPTTATRAITKPAKADLEQLLRNEKINGPADRDMTVAAQDMCTFRGCYVYVHDMDERTKPVMVRDYTKPSTKEQGKWPQFRLTSAGRCPFIEDNGYTKRLMEQERKAADQAKAQQEIAATRRTRATSAMEDNVSNLRRSPRKVSQPNDLAKPLDPPKVLPAKRPHDNSTAHASTEDAQMPPMFGSAQVSRRGLPRMVGGEPIASGVQPSNITSAIRSQIVSSNISSTAPGLNRRMPDTKEVSALKRKVLERGASMGSAQSVPSSYMNDMRAAINDDQQGPPPRAAKRRALETLGVVHENGDDGQADAKRRKAAPRKKATEKEPKPGYCENCRDKFEDFDTHIQSRKHRKFATTQENWKELDALLLQLRRPHKEHH